MSSIQEWRRGYVAARAARARLGLGMEAPLSDALLVIEDLAGVPVTVLVLPEGLAGLHGRKYDRSFIFVNGTEASVRQRFTLAHEFGHVELGHAGSVDYAADLFGDGSRPPAEAQADGFAAEFLAPISGVRGWLEAVGDPPDKLETVVRLAEYFHVSAKVALYRLQAARYLTKDKYAPMEAQIRGGEHTTLSRRLGLRDVNDTLSSIKTRNSIPRLPRATLGQAAAAYERGLLTVEQIAHMLEVDPRLIRAEFERRGVTPGHYEPDY
jgi:Zn-dependent peptidase ImmA (M78 family)